MKPVLAIAEAKNNAELIAQCAQLGYLQDDWLVFDATYGKGRFWTEWQPKRLITNDLDQNTNAQMHADFTDLPMPNDSMDAVVFDPPYKLSGTPSGEGPASGDESYGVKGKYVPVRERHNLMLDGADECARILKRGGYLLIKCQDQVSSGRVHWQTFMMWDHMSDLELVDMLHLRGYRKQPKGRRQLHARRNYSTLMIWEKM